jgi:hypothetical protein
MAEGTGELLAAKFEAIFPHLDERQRRRTPMLSWRASSSLCPVPKADPRLVNG